MSVEFNDYCIIWSDKNEYYNFLFDTVDSSNCYVS